MIRTPFFLQVPTSWALQVLALRMGTSAPAMVTQSLASNRRVFAGGLYESGRKLQYIVSNGLQTNTLAVAAIRKFRCVERAPFTFPRPLARRKQRSPPKRRSRERRRSRTPASTRHRSHTPQSTRRRSRTPQSTRRRSRSPQNSRHSRRSPSLEFAPPSRTPPAAADSTSERLTRLEDAMVELLQHIRKR